MDTYTTPHHAHVQALVRHQGELLAQLQQRFPTLGLTHGYIGNCDMGGGDYDDRQWMLFTQLVDENTGRRRNVYLDGPWDFDVEALTLHLQNWVVHAQAVARGQRDTCTCNVCNLGRMRLRLQRGK